MVRRLELPKVLQLAKGLQLALPWVLWLVHWLESMWAMQSVLMWVLRWVPQMERCVSSQLFKMMQCINGECTEWLTVSQ